MKSGMKAVSNWAAAALLATVGIGMSACQPQPVYGPAWYDVYGNYCGNGDPRPGCNFYSDGSKVVAAEDPYFASNNLYYGDYTYVDSYGYIQHYSGWAWQSQDGVLYDDYGNALNEDQDQDSRDVIATAAAQEETAINETGKAFAQKYALAESTGIHIARTLNDWATLAKKQKRARTMADVADFSKRLYGVSMDKTTVAIDQAKKGDTSGLEAVNVDVATYWGTSPETSKTILKNWYKDQLQEVNVK